jgi:molecular chaperone DnaJ
MRAALAGGVTASLPSRASGSVARREVWSCARRSHRTAAGGASTSTVGTAEEMNAYEVLGVDVTASHRAVRDAFRLRAKDAHPDRGGTSEAFDALKRAQDVLTNDDARTALDARLLDVPIGSLSLEELKWSRELQRLAEEEESGEVRGTDAVLASARAYAVAERALEAIAVKKKKDAAKKEAEKKTEAFDSAQTARRRNLTMANRDEGRGDDAFFTLTLTPEMVSNAFRDAGDDSSDVAVFAVDAAVRVNCPKCDGWGEKQGHWTAAVDKLCPRCFGCGRVETKKKVRVPVRLGVLDNETVIVRGAGDAGFKRQLTVLGAMGDAGVPGDLIVTARVLREGDPGFVKKEER